MTLTDAVRSGVFAALAVFACGAESAVAASASSIYDMDRMLSEPHPLAHQYGTRWRPAAVQPAPRPFAAPVMAPNLGVDSGNGKVGAQMPVVTPMAVPARQAQPRAATRATTRATTPTRTRPNAASAKKQNGFVSEIKLGVLAHDQGPFSSNKEEGVDTNVEVRFVSPDILKAIWSPRPHIGFNANSSGSTSSVFIGLTYEWDFWKNMFAGFSLGGAVHNGETDQGTAELDEKELGCRVLFRESIEVGYRINKHHSLSGFLDHISNAKLCDTNEGVENAGIRYGYRF
ncbi:MAG: acyloxyacyl hydrolase [Proteobacteria bacterium]|nr:acyloxyacyl hydrolase [Pseudomonadota bacterium]